MVVIAMKTMAIVALIVLAAVASLRPAAAAVWQFPTPVARAPCRIGGWYLAQFSNTDEWGNTVTWLAYTPYYVCD